MGYQPIYDGEFDVVAYGTGELIELLEAIFEQKLVLIHWVTCGPGGVPTIRLRGTRRQFMGWLEAYYDHEHEAFVRDEQSDAQTWMNAVEAYGFTFVA
jgi:hypothetical protein